MRLAGEAGYIRQKIKPKSPMRIRLLLFATCRDAVGGKEVELELAAGTTVGMLRKELASRYPKLKPMKDILSVAVNAEYVGDETVLKSGDEVALIPPVSGG